MTCHRNSVLSIALLAICLLKKLLP